MEHKENEGLSLARAILLYREIAGEKIAQCTNPELLDLIRAANDNPERLIRFSVQAGCPIYPNDLPRWSAACLAGSNVNDITQRQLRVLLRTWFSDRQTKAALAYGLSPEVAASPIAPRRDSGYGRTRAIAENAFISESGITTYCFP